MEIAMMLESASEIPRSERFVRDGQVAGLIELIQKLEAIRGITPDDFIKEQMRQIKDFKAEYMTGRRLAESHAFLLWAPLFFPLLLFSYFVWRRFKTPAEPRVQTNGSPKMMISRSALSCV